MNTYEHWVSDNCLVEAKIAKIDMSFDHALGKHKAWDLEIEAFRVLMYVNGSEYDVTQSIKDNGKLDYSIWRSKLLEIAYDDMRL